MSATFAHAAPEMESLCKTEYVRSESAQKCSTTLSPALSIELTTG